MDGWDCLSVICHSESWEKETRVRHWTQYSAMRSRDLTLRLTCLARCVLLSATLLLGNGHSFTLRSWSDRRTTFPWGPMLPALPPRNPLGWPHSYVALHFFEFDVDIFSPKPYFKKRKNTANNEVNGCLKIKRKKFIHSSSYQISFILQYLLNLLH